MYTVIVDVDDVLADLLPVWLGIYNEIYHDNLCRKDITAWDVSKFVVPECGSKIFDLLDTPGIYDQVKPVRGALRGVNQLRAAGLRLLFVTAATLQGKLDWLKRFGFLTDESSYIYCRNKSLIRADAILDDCFENVRDFPGKGVLYHQPYNAAYDWPYRAKNWKQAVELLLSENNSNGGQWR